MGSHLVRLVRLAPAEFQTLGIRVPAHPVILALLEASGVPWASTSANLSGSPALQDGEAAVAQRASAGAVLA